MAALAPRLASLTIEIEGGNTEEVTVVLQGKTVPHALIGAARPVDPGEQVITVESDAWEAAPVRFTLDEGGNQTVTSALHSKGDAPVLASPPPRTIPSDQGTKGSRVPAYVALGVGGVGLAVGTIFLVDHFTKKNQAAGEFEDNECDVDGNCNEDQRDQIIFDAEAAARSGTTSVIGYSVGGAALATGVVLLLLRNKQEKRASSTRRVATTFGWKSVGVRGTF
jgi:hypothetical protein